MLQLLHIENIAVIERADISFRAGFNALTGETGAGKSIVIDSLGAVLGARTSRDLIRTGAAKAFVSAEFDGVDASLPVLAALGVEPEDGVLLLQRDIYADGKNICRANGRPITAEEYNALTALRMENTGKVRGVFDINFDKREFSAVHIMDGWQTWAMRDVSVAAYHATRSQFASSDDQWRKLLDHLSGKEITSAGHLSARNFSFGDEIIESDSKLNFYVRTEFDVDAVFGTFVCTDKNDDWLNIYANYDIAENRPCDTLELTLCKGDGSEENWSYQLNAAEREVLLRKMEEYCQKQTGMSLHDYAQQFREEPEQRQGPVMKL